jgi:N-acetyl-1-D-myo-inositol-2-amino-2-deoxy-alpha-D-glucopyranoside deacetylase
MERESEEGPRSVASRVAEALAAALLGAVTGIIGTFGHQLQFGELGVPLPVGLIAGLVAVTCLLVGIRFVFESRWYCGLAALGVVGAIAIFALPSPNGSVLLPNDLQGIIWTVGPTLIAAAVLAWPRVEHAAARSTDR